MTNFIVNCVLVSTLLLGFIQVQAKPLNKSSDNEELVFVHALWRHGDRNPNLAWPTDPNQEDAWPQGWGSLSSRGMRQQFELGRRIRGHLGDFVSRHYVAQEVYVRSSDINRTLNSAASNMIGFFDHEEKQHGKDFPKGSNWPFGFVPIPIHTVSIDQDYLKSMPETCQRMKDVKKILKHTPEYKKLEKDNKKLLKTFSNLTGLDLKLKDVFHIHDTLFIEKSNGKSWSPGITKDLYKKLGKLTQEFLDLKYGIGLKPSNDIDFDVELPKLNGGWVLSDMVDRMKEKRDCLENESNATDSSCSWIGRLKYFAYSGHEESITSAFRTYGFTKTNFDRDGMPSYASSLVVELWKNKDNGVYFVKVYYLPREEDTIDITNKIVGCENGCTLDEFAKRSKKYRLVPNADAYCANGIGNDSPEFGPQLMILLIAVLAATLTMNNNK